MDLVHAQSAVLLIEVAGPLQQKVLSLAILMLGKPEDVQAILGMDNDVAGSDLFRIMIHWPASAHLLFAAFRSAENSAKESDRKNFFIAEF
jgi:hypothetical protein